MAGMVIPLQPRRQARDAESLLHDIRGPLTVIRGQCHAIVRAGGRGGDLIGRLGLIDAEVDRIAAAIDEVRRVLSGGPGEEAEDVVELRTLLLETIRRHDGPAGERGITLRLESSRPRVEVIGRLGELRRVLDNLLTNAVRHSPYGATITVTCRVGRRGGEVAITNDGPAPANPTPLRWAFAPNGDSGGWGIGLDIVDDIVARHDGTVVVEPSGTGPTIRVTLPSAGATA